MMADDLVHGLIADGAIRFFWVEVADITATCLANHKLEPASADFVGELIAATAIQSAWVKDDARVSVLFAGVDPEFQFNAEVDGSGDIVARLQPAKVEPEFGLFTAQMVLIRHLGPQQVYRGQSLIKDDSVELGVERHLRSSDQLDVALRIGTCASGPCGLMLERMPTEVIRSSMDTDTWRTLRLQLAELPLDTIAAGVAAGELMGLELRILERTPLRWQCRCSDDKVRDMLVGLGSTALLELADEDGGAEVTCNFCGVSRRWDEPELRALAQESGVVAEA
jgi:molecular chaperone Hsp33